MDLKNTLAAVSLSAAIIVLWCLFFAPKRALQRALQRAIKGAEQKSTKPSCISFEF